MTIARTTKVFVVLFVAILFGSSLVTAQSPESLSITVSLFNAANLSLPSLTEAESRASLILSRAGVSVQWLNCTAHPGVPAPDQFQTPSPCSAIAFPTHLSVRILPGIRAAAPLLSKDTFGQSFLNASGEGAYSNIYYQNLATSLAAESLAPPEILGHVIAHEIGHLLLGPNSHSPAGIMSSPWTPDQLRLAARGALTFSSAQALVIRSRLLSSPTLAARAPGKTSRDPNLSARKSPYNATVIKD